MSTMAAMTTVHGHVHETDGPGTAALDRLVGFGRFLRANGMNVGTGRILSFVRAAALSTPSTRSTSGSRPA